jgi:hypothetical protein
VKSRGESLAPALLHDPAMTRSKTSKTIRTLDLAQLQHAQGGFMSVITNAIKTATTASDTDSKEYYKVTLQEVFVS